MCGWCIRRSARVADRLQQYFIFFLQCTRGSRDSGRPADELDETRLPSPTAVAALGRMAAPLSLLHPVIVAMLDAWNLTAVKLIRSVEESLLDCALRDKEISGANLFWANEFDRRFTPIAASESDGHYWKSKELKYRHTDQRPRVADSSLLQRATVHVDGVAAENERQLFRSLIVRFSLPEVTAPETEVQRQSNIISRWIVPRANPSTSSALEVRYVDRCGGGDNVSFNRSDATCRLCNAEMLNPAELTRHYRFHHSQHNSHSVCRALRLKRSRMPNARYSPSCATTTVSLFVCKRAIAWRSYGTRRHPERQPPSVTAPLRFGWGSHSTPWTRKCPSLCVGCSVS